jgi:uncharacterized protein YukE
VTVSSRCSSLPADTEARLAGFTELVATAIANAEAQVARLARGWAGAGQGIRTSFPRTWPRWLSA